VVASLGELLPEDRCDAFLHAGIAPLCGIGEALVAADAAARIGESWAVDPAPSILNPAPENAPAHLIGEHEAKGMLALAGVPITAGGEARGPADACAIAERLGYPVVVKAVGLAHKTEAGGVALNLADADALTAAVIRIKGTGERVLIEKMVMGGLVELIVGVSRDPVYGLMLTVGAGGVLAELLAPSPRSWASPASPRRRQVRWRNWTSTR